MCIAYRKSEYCCANLPDLMLNLSVLVWTVFICPMCPNVQCLFKLRIPDPSNHVKPETYLDIVNSKPFDDGIRVRKGQLDK